MWDRPLGGGVNLQLYAAPVGEPALGPVAFMHRTSAISNPIAPISHHWFDSTHITYGVVTSGLYGNKWKLEASAFNGREPDEERTDFDFDKMDSWSGRLWYLPTKGLAFQVSGGRLKDAEQHEPDEPRIDVERWTASATYHYTLEQKIVWATTLGWGRNKEVGEDGGPTDAYLIETNLTFADRDSIFARLETVRKSSHDLNVEGDGRYQVGKIQVGYNRYFANWAGLKPGIGVAGSAGLVPQSLVPVYGERWNPGGAVYLTLRPAGRSPE